MPAILFWAIFWSFCPCAGRPGFWSSCACVTFGAQACSAFAVARMPVSRLSALSNMIPVVGVLTGMLLLGETMSPIQWVASALVLGVVLVSQHLQRKDSDGGGGGREESLVNEALRKEEAGKPLLAQAEP